MNFNEQLLLTIADKLAVGLIILVIGLWINKKLEKFRAELSRVSKEHEIRFGKLHEKRGEIIADLYSLLYQAHVSVKVLELRTKDTDDDTMATQAANEAHEICSKALSFFEKNRLYLSRELADLIHSILSTMELTSTSFTYSGPIRKTALTHWNEQRQKIALIMSRLEREFRVILGSEIESNTGSDEH